MNFFNLRLYGEKIRSNKLGNYNYKLEIGSVNEVLKVKLNN